MAQLSGENVDIQRRRYQENMLQVYDQLTGIRGISEVKAPENKKKSHKFILKISGMIIFAAALLLLLHFVMIRGKIVAEEYYVYVQALEEVLLICGVAFFIINVYEEQRTRNLEARVEEGRRLEGEWNQQVIQMRRILDHSDSEQEVQTEDVLYVSDEILNVMLNNAHRKCTAGKIKTCWNLTLPRQDLLEPAERVGFISNLLDNAMEACLRVEGERFIHMTTSVHANFWSIVIVNSKSSKETPVKKNFATQKEGDHGLGLQIVSAMVENHDGIIEFYDEGDKFRACAMLRIR